MDYLYLQNHFDVLNAEFLTKIILQTHNKELQYYGSIGHLFF